eukprot:UN25861
MGQKLLEEAKALDPKNSSALWFLGQLYNKKEMLRQGTETYEACLELDPPNRLAILYELAEIYELDLKNDNAAARIYKFLLQEEHCKPEILYNAGRFFQRIMNEIDLAKKCFEKVC